MIKALIAVVVWSILWIPIGIFYPWGNAHGPSALFAPLIGFSALPSAFKKDVNPTIIPEVIVPFFLYWGVAVAILVVGWFCRKTP